MLGSFVYFRNYVLHCDTTAHCPAETFYISSTVTLVRELFHHFLYEEWKNRKNCIETKAPKMISMKETKQPTWLMAHAAFCIPYECSKYVLIESSWRASNMNCFSESNAKGMKWTIHRLFFFHQSGKRQTDSNSSLNLNKTDG